MRKWNWLLIVFCTILLIGCSSDNTGSPDSGENEGSDKPGEVKLATELNVAINTQPTTLDHHMTTATIVSDLARHIYEQLVTLNSSYEVVPMLAESIDESEEGKKFTFTLRKGVTFHNGKEMKAEDVIASLEKWQATSSKAIALIPDATFTEVDEYTVEMSLKEPIYGILTLLADVGQSAVIMPKEIAEAAGPTGATEYIGTGPFKFTEWKHDHYIHFSKFEEYSSLDQAADGLSGEKEALVDDIYFHIITDGSTRLTGLQTGEYDLAMAIPYDNYDMVNNDPNLETAIDIMGPVGLVLNKKDRIFSDIKMRQALNAALDMESIMVAAYTDDKFFRLDHGYMQVEQVEWYNEAGKDRYNINDPEKAKQLFAEAGYDGEEIKIITTKDYEYMYNSAVVIQEQLKKIGVNVKLEVTDWATILDMRTKPGEYDGFVTAFPKVMTPQQILHVNPEWPGWTDDAEITKFLGEISDAKSAEDAKASFESLQDRMYDYLTIIKYGDYYNLYGNSAKLDGLTLQDGLILWNTTKAN